MYLAFAQRASSEPFNNLVTIHDILIMRYQAAERAGKRNFAEWQRGFSMLQSLEAVNALVMNISQALHPVVQDDLRALQSFAEEQGHVGRLEPWDIDFWEEKWRVEQHGFDEEDLM
eukprot:4959024-Amphidinium_carterae.1